MKLLILWIALFFKMVLSDGKVCFSDGQCVNGECCLANRWSNYGECKGMGDDVGDRCGGRYLCASCANGLVCVPDPHNFWSHFRVGNGSCQRLARHGWIIQRYGFP